MSNALIYSITAAAFPIVLKDPFLFVAHHVDHYPAGNAQLGPATEASDQGQFSMYYGDTVPGFPAHPHTGFETITIVDEGMVDHFDSLGNSGRYGQGDVQWLSTGHGVQHSEMFPLLSETHDNTLELFQIWFNASALQKQTDPDYKMMWQEAIPHVAYQDNSGLKTDVRVISGRFDHIESLARPTHSWAQDAANKVNIFLLNLEAHATITIPATSATSNRLAYFYQGDTLSMAGTDIPNKHLVHLQSDADIVVQAGPIACKVLWLEGEPIGEPVAMRGPFVLNTDTELQQAFARFRATEFGGWPWPNNAPTFPRTQGRVASFDHGQTIEYPPSA